MPYNYDKGRYVHAFPTWKGLSTIEKNLITFAQTRSGKGATQIIPFLLNTDDCNALVIDPKGEAAEATAKARKDRYGQRSHILDPFHTTQLQKSSLARYNPLDEIDASQRSAFRQINALADGLVMRHSAEAGHWDGGGLEVLAGFIAHVVSAPEFEGRRSLVTVRQLLKSTGEAFGAVVDAMAENSACGGLAQTGANKLLNTGNEAGHFLSVATTNTKWLDDPDIAECLSETTFKMSDLKRKNVDIFLVLPMDTLGDYGRFLRLFVRLAIHHMQQKMPDGSLKGRNTFFILDEFYSLGHIEEISKTVGGMPGFNLHLWPFLQDYNQLLKLYDEKGAGTFMANCDARFFFGVDDLDTAEYVSRAAGRVQEHELKVKPPEKPQTSPEKRYLSQMIHHGFWAWLMGSWQKTYLDPEYVFWHRANVPPQEGTWGVRDPEIWGEFSLQEAQKTHFTAKAYWQQKCANEEASYQDAMNKYAHARSRVGQPRVAPDEVMQITKKNPKRGVSDFALVLQGGVCWKAPLRAYFEEKPKAISAQTVPTVKSAHAPPKQTVQKSSESKAPSIHDPDYIDQMVALYENGKNVSGKP